MKKGSVQMQQQQNKTNKEKKSSIPKTEQEKDEVGIATGLAWTATGGEILYVDAGYNITAMGSLEEVN